MRIRFTGAAREVTGSAHLVQVNGRSILLDCGLFQGRRFESQRKNRALPYAPDRIDAVVLSHAHIDHAGRLPYLVKEGYRGPIHCTAATRDLCEVMLADSAHIQEKDAEFLAKRQREYVEPLYALADVSAALTQFRPHRYHDRFEVVPGVTGRFVDAGHILGSASVELEWEEDGVPRRLGFSGDVGRAGLPIIRDPEPLERLDWVILESTYGDRDHESIASARDELARIVTETAARGGRIIIPAFAVGRTQELLYDFHALARAGRIPRIPIVIDSPLANEATQVFRENRDSFDTSEPLVRKLNGDGDSLFDFDLVQFTPDVRDSKAMMHRSGPMVVIAASGMAESGRVLHHLAYSASDPRTTILVVGFMAEHTLGRRIVERRPMLKIFGDEVELRARVETLNGYSAHADRMELQRWLDSARETSAQLADVFLVHGEPAAQDAFAAQLTQRGYRVQAPEPGADVTR
ncbi:MAG: MBL fold metallo-hydrolase [Gemmatimonadaceae bacterium]|nr:MBL fold metallo-hydrolase [Gemmatimonadaceae bacterium]MCW5826964.1 MBL fold metallo-hydrolase [Gemmatimonadaceae bacterium]